MNTINTIEKCVIEKATKARQQASRAWSILMADRYSQSPRIVTRGIRIYRKKKDTADNLTCKQRLITRAVIRLNNKKYGRSNYRSYTIPFPDAINPRPIVYSNDRDEFTIKRLNFLWGDKDRI
jgi:hypothetical protein